MAIANSRQGTSIITCSYEARTYGIKTGMRLKQARQLCPARPGRYTATATTIMDDGAGLNTVYQDILRRRSIS